MARHVARRDAATHRHGARWRTSRATGNARRRPSRRRQVERSRTHGGSASGVGCRRAPRRRSGRCGTPCPAGDPEDLEDRSWVQTSAQRAVLARTRLRPADEHAQAGGVQERRPPQVDHQWCAPAATSACPAGRAARARCRRRSRRRPATTVTAPCSVLRDGQVHEVRSLVPSRAAAQQPLRGTTRSPAYPPTAIRACRLSADRRCRRVGPGFDPAAAARAPAPSGPPRASGCVHVHEVPAPARRRTADVAAWVNPPVYAAFARRGLPALWRTSARRPTSRTAGEHVVLATGTASGKCLGYLLPALTAVVDGAGAPPGAGRRRSTSPRPRRWPPTSSPGWQSLARARPAGGDLRRRHPPGRAALDPRPRAVRPHQPRPACTTRCCRGTSAGRRSCGRCATSSSTSATSTAASSGRTWRRCCAGCGGCAARYGASPTFVLASATVADPGGHAARPHRAAGRARSPEDGSPRESMTFGAVGAAACSPAAVSTMRPHRRSAVAETADLLADLVVDGVQTVAFARSRRGVEVVAASARRSLAEVDRRRWCEPGGGLPRAATCPRTGACWSPRCGRAGCVGLAATNALELGIDVSGLDAVLLAGWPGTLASLWQQAGRAGRAGARSLAVMVAADDPLDTYLVHHPEAVFGRPVEAAVLDPQNPYVLGAAPGRRGRRAAADRGRRRAVRPDHAGRWSTRSSRAGCCAAVRRGWYWTHARPGDRPRVDLRGVRRARCASSRPHRPGARHRRRAAAPTQRPPGARLRAPGRDLRRRPSWTSSDARRAGARRRPRWSTHARSVTDVRHRAPVRAPSGGAGSSCRFGDVEVRSPGDVASCAGCPRGEVLGEHPLDLPARTPAHQGGVVDDPDGPARGRRASTRRDIPGAAARRRARGDRDAAAGGDLRPLGHRRRLDRAAPGHRPADDPRLRRPSRRRRLRRARVRGARGPGSARRGTRSRPASARPAARRACSRPSAATATSRWTSGEHMPCCRWCWPSRRADRLRQTPAGHDD